MFKEHPNVNDPEDLTLWRYLDLFKFESILESQGLFFAKPDALNEVDPWEGQRGKTEIRILGSNAMDDAAKSRENPPQNWPYISCWHKNDYESMPMWSLYLKNPKEGVAVKTTYRRLKQCFEKIKNTIYMGEIQYVRHYDLQTTVDTRHPDPYIIYYFNKNMAFRDERELRAIVMSPKDYPEEPGIIVPGDIKVLITNIVISPYASQEYEEMIRALVAKHGFPIEPERSDIERQPVSALAEAAERGLKEL